MNKTVLSMVISMVIFLGFSILKPTLAVANSKYASVVMDNRNGEILRSRNSNTRLHPASLTKMMTLYIAFEAIKNQEILADTMVVISKKAASEPPSKIGLRSGQSIKLRYLIRAAAIMSANDAATAIGEAISGSEAAFSRRMNKTAKALGMRRTTFKNAHGLTENGHLSTAIDMTILGRSLFFHHKDYYHLFSRKKHNAGIKTISHTNTRFLNTYKGADGIKTGYTRKAGYNLTASAKRGNTRIIATVFGGKKIQTRNNEMERLLNIGFSKAISKVTLVEPPYPIYALKINTLRRIPQPIKRPVAVINSQKIVKETKAAMGYSQPIDYNGPIKRPISNLTDSSDRSVLFNQVITRSKDIGQKNWTISLGDFTTRDRAERYLLKTTLTEIDTLKMASQKIIYRPKGWEAIFMHLNKNNAEMACQKLEYQGYQCKIKGPDT